LAHKLQSFLFRSTIAYLGLSTLPLPQGLSADLGGKVERASLRYIELQNAQTVTVVMTEYRFTPNHLVFSRGVLYKLVLANHGATLHEFTAPEFFKSISIYKQNVLSGEGREIAVQPHRTAQIIFVPRQVGKYHLFCADHDFLGMTGEITVSQH
jgi:uncharacterized cupredoxin-like copper-binding protein